MHKTKSISWPSVLLMALALSILAAAAIWGPVVFRQHAAALKAEATQDARRPTLQTFVERGPFADFDGNTKPLPLLPYDSISLERTPCFGACPIYIVTFFKDGHATLETENWNQKGKQYFVGNVSMVEYARMTQMVDLAKAAAHQTEYMGQWTDDYSAIVRANSKDQSWVVSDYGQVAPIEVWALETLLHGFRENQVWVPATGP